MPVQAGLTVTGEKMKDQHTRNAVHKTNCTQTTNQQLLQTGPSSSDRNQPNVVSLFDTLGEEHKHLPYDPDEISHGVIEELGSSKSEVTLDEVTSTTKNIAGIVFPDVAIIRAKVRLEEEYNPDEITILLHLFRAHGEVIKEGIVTEQLIEPQKDMSQTPDINRTFIMVRSLNERTKGAIKHMVNGIKTAVTRSKNHATSYLNSNQQ